jgi:hypothetical protein
MIESKKLITRAEKYVGGHKPADVHPDVASRMVAFERAKDRGATPLQVQAHARSLMQLVDAIAGAEVEEVETVTRPRATAKKAPAKRAAAKKSAARS